MTELQIRNLKVALNTVMDAHLSQMKFGLDDSVTGFNEAWGLVSDFLEKKAIDAR